MAAGLKNGKEEVKDIVTGPKLKWKSQNVGDEKEDISSTDTGEEMVEDASHGPETHVSKQRYNFYHKPSGENDKAEDVTNQAK